MLSAAFAKAPKELKAPMRAIAIAVFLRYIADFIFSTLIYREKLFETVKDSCIHAKQSKGQRKGVAIIPSQLQLAGYEIFKAHLHTYTHTHT